MKLQVPNLSLGIQGDDAKLLDSELQQLGYAIPATEVAASSFGRGTYDAVGSFQAKNGLPITNTVEATSADKTETAVDAFTAGFDSSSATNNSVPRLTL